MRRFHELRKNPVSVTFRDGTGATITVVAERLRQGLVKITCDCQRQSKAGWCQHCLAVFSDREVFEDNKHREAFERIVGGTFLEEAAGKLTKALDTFAVAYRHMKFGRPADLDLGQLRKFADKAHHASSAAEHLVLALERFIDELRLRPSRTVRAKSDDTAHVLAGKITEQLDAENASMDHPNSVAGTPNTSVEQSKPATPTNSPERLTAPDLTSASRSKDKESALEMVRRGLEKDLDLE
jgi:hypothetical protein